MLTFAQFHRFPFVDNRNALLFVLLIVVGFGVLVLALRFVMNWRRYGDFPIVGSRHDLREALNKGTEMYPSQAFAIPTSPPLVIFPISMMDQIKSLPESKVSAARELFRRAAGHYSKMGTNTLAAITALRRDLNRDHSKIGILQEETRYAFERTLGSCDQWTPVRVYTSINRVIGMVSGRVFLGKELSRTNEWISIATEWSNDVFALLLRTAYWPDWILPYVTPYFTETKRVLEQRARTTAFLGPTFSKQLEVDETKEKQSADNGEETLASWILKYVSPRHRNVESLVRHQLGISWAAIHTSTHALTQIIYDLAAHPEYQEPLRAEIQSVLSELGDEEGLNQRALSRLEKMDSVMRESMRLGPATLVAPMRLAVQNLTLSTGQTLKAGTPFGFHSMAINNSKILYCEPPPDVFDGFRFYDMRRREGEEGKHRFGATGAEETFDFGHGIHSCPGRFFAATEIKIILMYVLMQYEMKLKEGTRRPENSLNEVWVIPDQKAEILFKRRRA